VSSPWLLLLDHAEAESRTAADLFDRVGDHQYQARVTLIKAEVAIAHGRQVEAAALAAESTEALRARSVAGAHTGRCNRRRAGRRLHDDPARRR
jgi:hypothetical protein